MNILGISTEIRDNSLICIDEPELYLHPSTIHLIKESLISLSKSGYQILFSTHSPALLSAENAMDAIQIYKNISVKWHEVKYNSDIFKFGEKITKEMLEFMSYDTGCLEFAQTNDNKIVFFEVNQMAGPLPFEGEDTLNMTKYYFIIFDEMFK